MKKCQTCREEKSFSDFHRNRSKSDRLHGSCKACEKKRLLKNNSLRKFAQYQNSAKIRNLKFQLTLEEFNNLRLADCYYCGDYSLFNGLDRLDNDIGYEIANVVPCCGYCNKAKHVLSEDQFLQLVEKIYNNRIAV